MLLALMLDLKLFLIVSHYLFNEISAFYIWLNKVILFICP